MAGDIDTMKYSVLFRISLRCIGSPDKPVSGEKLIMEPITSDHPRANALRDYRLLIRRQNDGLRVLLPHDNVGTAWIPFTDLELSFRLRLQDVSLSHILDLKTLQSMHSPTYRNSGDRSELTLAGDDTDEKRSKDKALATILINGIRSDWAENPRKYAVRFPLRLAHWVYYVISSQSVGSLQIEDERNRDEWRFEGVIVSDNEEQLRRDRIALNLIARDGNTTVYRFHSINMLPVSLDVKSGISLKSDTGLTYFSDLPPPQPDNLSNLGSSDQKPKEAINRIIVLKF